ncbi:MAG: hypothetical protein AABX19_00655 [Nanoarchaeota archaeon]
MLKLLKDGDVIRFIGIDIEGTTRIINVLEELDSLKSSSEIRELLLNFRNLIVMVRERKKNGIKDLEIKIINLCELIRNKYGRTGIAVRFNNDVYNKIARYNDRNIKDIFSKMKNNMLIPYANRDLERMFRGDRLIVQNINLSDNKKAIKLEIEKLCRELAVVFITDIRNYIFPRYQELVDSSVNTIECPNLESYISGSLYERKSLFENYIDRMIMATRQVLHV